MTIISPTKLLMIVQVRFDGVNQTCRHFVYFIKDEQRLPTFFHLLLNHVSQVILVTHRQMTHVMTAAEFFLNIVYKRHLFKCFSTINTSLHLCLAWQNNPPSSLVLLDIK